MSSTRTQSQLCTATPISSFVQCHITSWLLPSSVATDSLKYMLGYSQSQEQWEIIYTYCCKSYSGEVKQAVSHLSITEIG